MTRLSLVGVTLLTLLVAALGPAQADDPLSLDQLRADRKEAAQRERRIIFNNDGNEPIYLCRDTTPAELLRHRTAPLANTHVDTIFYCTWSSGFGMFTHDTKVGNVFKTKEGLFSKNLIEKMLAAGTDPLKVMADFGKQNEIEIFWSFRMNDTHDAGLSGYGPIMLRANPLKLEHPDWLIGTPKSRPKFGGWSAVDYTRPEIRDLAVSYVEEVCQNYDINGIELDFFRHPVFFKRAAQSGTPCTEEERALMTEMIRRMRKVTEVEGQRRKKPILLSVRVPDSVAYCRDSGLDIENWLGEELIDLMTVSGYFQLRPWEDSVELGKKYDIPVYPSLDESRVRDVGAKKSRMTVEAYRGRALSARSAGMAGLYLFNSFNPHAAIWKELGDPATLAKQDHDYFASIRGVGAAAGGALPHRDYQPLATLNPKAPLSLSPDKSVTVSFYNGVEYQKLNSVTPPQITLRLQFDKEAPENIRVALNEETLKASTSEAGWLEFPVQPGMLKLNENEVIVSLTDKDALVKWTDLQCRVRWNRDK
ncbi:hypothetical protein Pla52o_15580 [Novipirellula galeiformis]|uniref:Glycosyl hydrolase-like 10 domain-containing protein n=1 Tax=Novipirellula galeiformis TaxID=2528004 RepID=A0A5C6CKY5_9BACT|nr:hypothetical protein [Novipirellula galeiformis]TWU25260.1 hypothetical protein Pla52o_15580 [Novipirellula galeiformis]